MAPIYRVKLAWTGFTGGPGYSIFHFRDFDTEPGAGLNVAGAQAAVDRVDTFIQAINNYIPNTVYMRSEPDVEVLEESNGQLQEIYQTSPLDQLRGAATTTIGYSAASGAVINWRTNGIRNGRRVRGRTFLVPLASSAYQGNGSLVDVALTAIRGAADALSATGGSPDLGVWARPSAPGANDGDWFVVAAANVPDMAAVLRSRRD